MAASASITHVAYAKINLALSVGPAQPLGSARAGWHPIATWMHAIDLCDEIRVTSARASSFHAAWADDAPRPTPIDWPPERDLAARAHCELEAAVGRSLPAEISLIKRIPVGAGLGGGSSDAAATLLALREAFSLPITTRDLAAIATSLGSDVSFFVDDQTPPRPAIVRGFGEGIERVPRVAAAVVLIVPDFACETSAVYKEFDRNPTNGVDHERVSAMASRGTLPSQLDFFNDLAEPAMRLHPDLRTIQSAAADVLGAPVHMTGSGSALFALTSSPPPRDIVSRLMAALPSCVVLRARLV